MTLTRNEEVLLRVKEQRYILHEINKRKANWIGHFLRRNCLLQWVIKWKIKGGIGVTGRRGRRRRKLLDDLKERRGYSHLKEEALDRTMWWVRFGRGFEPVVRQTTKWMNDDTTRNTHIERFETKEGISWQSTVRSSWSSNEMVLGIPVENPLKIQREVLRIYVSSCGLH